MVLTILDIETTGFSPVNDDILEVGYLRITQNCKSVGHGTLYFYKDEFRIESPAQSVHHLSRSFLKQYEKEFYTNLATLYALCYQGVIIGKNSKGFDVPFIKEFINKYTKHMDPLITFGQLDLQTKCAPLFREYYLKKTGESAGRKTGTLENYVEMFGWSQEEMKRLFAKELGEVDRARAHGALYDAFMTFKVLERCVGDGIMKLTW